MRPYPEVATRVEQIINVLSNHSLEVATGKSMDLSLLSEVHAAEYVEFMRSLPQDLEPVAPTAIRTAGEVRQDSSFHALLGHYFFDPATPLMGSTSQAAEAAANISLNVADTLLSHDRSYGLCRPPGHHARHAQGGGYCIYNNVVLAAEYLTRRGKTVTILDLDYHHGNGTQEMLYKRSDIQYVSLHADPTSSYPFYWGWRDQTGAGEGKGFTHNYPMASTSSEDVYLNTLAEALVDVTDYSADIVLVSMGFDCYIDDPIAGMALTTDSYLKIGELLQDLPKVGVILEGGYHLPSIGNNFYNLYRGLEGL
jgi:acetoin utilization deacetylase AcuC-like enzyme